MKKHLLFPTIFFLLTAVFSRTVAQAPNWAWAKKGSGNQQDNSYCITADANGNIFATGDFESQTINFGTASLSNTLYPNRQMYLVKYDANGNVIWAKKPSSAVMSSCTGISADKNGNVYIAGWFQGASITFGAYTLYETGISGVPNLFVAKYNAAGNVLWAKSASTVMPGSANNGIRCTTDSSGSAYITGTSNGGPVVFGTDSVYGIFIAKYDSSGNYTWVRSGTNSSSSDAITGIDANAFNHIYITGYISSFSFDTIFIFGSDTIFKSGPFTVKYDLNGNVIWAKKHSYLSPRGIACDGAGNFYINGRLINDTLIFGTDSLFPPNIVTAKFDSACNLLWAKAPGCAYSGLHETYGITSDISGNTSTIGLLFIGWQDTVCFDSTTIASPNTYNLFVANYSPSGTLNWVISPNGNSSPYGYGICSGLGTDVYIAGTFNSSLTFGSTVLTASSSTYDMFASKLSSTAGSVPEIENQNILHINPNPFSMQTTLKTDIPFANATLTVDNCFGQTVAQIKNLNGQTFTFNRDNLTSGLYFVRLTADNKVIAVDKIVITDK